MAQGKSGNPARINEDDDSILPELTRAFTNVPIAADLEKIITGNKVISRDPNAPSDQAGDPPTTHDDDDDDEVPQHVYPTLSKARKIALPLLCMSGTFQQASAVVGVGLGIRLIGDELHIPEYQLQWLQSSVSLAYACTLLLFGRCADIWGHKVFFMSGLLMAGVFNLATGLAQTAMQIFVFRALTGAMFACVVPAAIGILASAFPPGPAKSRAFACFGAGAPIGNAVGLIIAGLTIEFAATGWRTFFYVSAGMTAGTGVLAYFLVPGPLLPNRKLKGQAVDIIGAFLAIAGLVLFVFALADGEGAPQGWKSPYIPTCLVIGVVLVAVFWTWERYLERTGKQPPLMKVSVWKKGKFAVLQLVTLCLFGGITATIFWITLYWQNYEELPVLEMTARFVPLSVTGVSVNFIMALLVAHIPGHYLVLVGITGSALSALLMAINDPSKTYWAYQFVSTCFTIWGADGIMLCGTLYVSRIVGPQDQAQGGSIFNTITQLGSALVLAVTTIVSDSVSNKEAAHLGVVVHGNRDVTTVIPKEAILKGYRAAFWMCFAFMCFSGIITLLFLRDMGMVGAKKAKKVIVPEEEGLPMEESYKK